VFHLRVLVGSQAYGLAGPDSDHDYAGFYVVSTEDFWRIDSTPPETIQEHKDATFHEVAKFFRLLTNGNLTVTEMLWAPVVSATPFGELVRAHRRCFLSERTVLSYLGYAKQQQHKINLRGISSDKAHHAQSWKHAAHVLRLCIAGQHLHRTGEVMVDVGEHRERILPIRRGLVTVDEALAAIDAELELLRQATRETTLPESPDFATINAMLEQIRRDSLGPAS